MIILLFFFFHNVTSQIIDCDQLFDKDKLELIGTPEIAAIPFGSYDIFHEKINKEINQIKERGKVFVQILVDTLGKVHCAKVIRSGNERLNTKALEFVENMEFSPAMNRGKKIMVSMVLLLRFEETAKKNE